MGLGFRGLVIFLVAGLKGPITGRSFAFRSRSLELTCLVQMNLDLVVVLLVLVVVVVAVVVDFSVVLFLVQLNLCHPLPDFSTGKLFGVVNSVTSSLLSFSGGGVSGGGVCSGRIFFSRNRSRTLLTIGRTGFLVEVNSPGRGRSISGLSPGSGLKYGGTVFWSGSTITCFLVVYGIGGNVVGRLLPIPFFSSSLWYFSIAVWSGLP